jgi:voltage-gated potassium channel
MKNVTRFLIRTTDTARELIVIYLVVLLSAAGLYGYFEQKPLFDSLWWAVVTAMTVGYGDSYPVTAGGRVVAIALMHAVPLFIIPIITSRLSAKLIVNSDAFTEHEQKELRRGIKQIKKHLKIKD